MTMMPSNTITNDEDDHNQDNCLCSMDLEDVTIAPIIFPSLIESSNSKEKSTNTIDDKTNHDDPPDDDDNDDDDMMMMIMMNASLGNTRNLCCCYHRISHPHRTQCHQ